MMVLPFDECGVGLAVFGSISSNLAITSIGRRSFFLSSSFFCLFSVLIERVVFLKGPVGIQSQSMETNTTIWSIEQSFDFYSRLLDELCARENMVH